MSGRLNGGANAAMVGLLFAAGTAVAGPIGGAMAEVAINLLSDRADDWLSTIEGRLLGRDGLGNADLRSAMKYALENAVDDLKNEWTGRVRSEQRSAILEVETELFRILRYDLIQFIQSIDNAGVSVDLETAVILSEGEARIRQALDVFLSPYLSGHRDQLVRLVQGRILDRVIRRFLEYLTVDRAENNRAWRSYQILVSQTTGERLQVLLQNDGHHREQLEAACIRLEEVSSRFESVPPDQRIAIGEEVLRTIADDVKTHTEKVVAESTQTVVESVANLEHGLDEIRLAVKRNASLPTTEVLLSGPVVSLGLQDRLNRADRLESRMQAAVEYSSIADTLGDAGYKYQEKSLRSRVAETYVQADRIDLAFGIWLNLALHDLETGEAWIEHSTSSGLREYFDLSTPCFRYRAQAALSRESWFEHPEAGRKNLAEAVRALVALDDEWAPISACWLGEMEAVDGGPYGCVSDESVEVIASLIPRAPSNIAVRMRVLLAEKSSDWTEILREAKGRGGMASADAALVLSRYGRYLAYLGQYDVSIESYHLAIGKFAPAGLLGDASQAIRSVNEVYSLYIGLSSEQVESHRQAWEIRNEPRRFGGRSDPRSVVIEKLYRHAESGRALGGGNIPDANQYTRRILWESRLSGHIDAERDAYILLGDVYRSASYGKEALQCYVLAGVAEKSDPTVQDAFLASADTLYVAAPWIVASTLAAIAKCGDVLEKSDVDGITPQVLLLLQGMKQGVTGLQVATEAWKCAESLCLAMSDESIDALLDAIEPLIERESGHYRHTDESMLGILQLLYRYRPEFQDRVAELITRCLEDGSIKQRMENFLSMVVQDDTFLRCSISGQAAAGDPIAVQVLARARVDHPSILQWAMHRFRDVLAYETGVERTRSEVSVRFEMVAELAFALTNAERDQLALHLAEIALDSFSPEAERSSAINAIRTLSRDLSQDMKSVLLDKVMGLVDADSSSHEIDVVWRETLNPFSRLMINMSAIDVNRSAMKTSAVLATNIEEGQRVFTVMQARASLGDREDLIAFVRFTVMMDPAIRPEIDPRELAIAEDPTIRAYAATIWSEHPDQYSDLLARGMADPDYEYDDGMQMRSMTLGGSRLNRPDVPSLALQMSQALL